MSKPEKLNTWARVGKMEMEKPKFLPKGKQLIIYPDHEPTSEKVDGKFGPRMLYVVWTSIGNVYVTPAQFIEINSQMAVSGYTAPINYP